MSISENYKQSKLNTNTMKKKVVPIQQQKRKADEKMDNACNSWKAIFMKV